jgi:uncharacterized protein YwgA
MIFLTWERRNLIHSYTGKIILGVRTSIDHDILRTHYQVHTEKELLMLHDGADDLISAVAEALGRKLSVNSFKDRLLMQKGCFILNEMGIGPRYSFRMYIRGPYSSELADDYYALMKKNNFSYSTSVPASAIKELSGIMSKGAPYAEAYTTVMLARKYNPHMNKEEIVKFVKELKPLLEKEVEEASSFLFP